MSSRTACDRAHIFWFDADDPNPVEGWYTCRDCGWQQDETYE